MSQPSLPNPRKTLLLVGGMIGIIVLGALIAIYYSLGKSRQTSFKKFLQVNESVQTTYRTNDIISFKITYPKGWHVFNEVLNKEDDTNYTERFVLHPDPVLGFPHFSPYIEGYGKPSNDQNIVSIAKSIAEFRENENTDDIQKLNWVTGEFKGSCFKYTYKPKDSGMWGTIEGNVKCFVDTGRVLFEFTIFSTNKEWEEKVDPNKEFARFFFEHLEKTDRFK